MSLMVPESFLLPFCLAVSICSVDRFCRTYLEPRGDLRWAFPVFLFSTQTALRLLLKTYEAAQISYLLSVMFQHLLILGAVFLFFRSHAAKKLLTTSVLIAAATLTANFCEAFLSCLALFALHTVWHVRAPVLGQTEAALMLCICTAAVLLALRLIRIHLDLDVLFFNQSRKWHGILSAPLLGITAVVDIANWSASNGILVRSRADLGIYYDQLFSHGELCVLTALSMFAAGCYLFGMQTICMEQQKNSQYHMQITAFQMLEQQHRRSERLRHDLKNHVIALSGLLERKEWDKIRDYLKQMEQCVNPQAGEAATGSSAVDALLFQKQKRAEEHHIRWECDVQIPPACGIHEFDLCVLFGNLLDNALKACEKCLPEKGRRICIQARPVKHCFLLEIKNCTDLKSIDQFQFFLKHPADGHGIGLRNVQDVLQKYDGTLQMDLQEDLLVASLLLPLQPLSRT